MRRSPDPGAAVAARDLRGGTSRTALSRLVALVASSRSAAALSYDLVVVGGGSAGLTAAKFASSFGKSSCIVERAKLGGDCTWTGCVPSKTLLSAATAVKSWPAGNPDVENRKADFKAVKERIRNTVREIYEEDDSADVLKKLGIDTINGEAKFEEPKKLIVKLSETGESMELFANDGIVIATGAGPSKAEEVIDGLDQVKYVTYEEVFDLDALPDSLTVVGGGPIGCELAQAYSKLGSQVTMIANGLLPDKDPEVGVILEQVLQKDGVKVVKGKVTRVRSDGPANAKHIASFSPIKGDTGDITEVKGDILLVAIGRKPVVGGMNLEELGVKLNAKGGIEVNPKLQTAVEGVYAAGDCTGDRQFTHYAGYQGAVAARNVLLPFSDPGVLDKYSIPDVTFTSPEVATVGMTHEDAIQEYGSNAVSVAFKEVKNMDRPRMEGKVDGFIKIIYRNKNYEILGASIVGPSAGELISEIAVAIKAKMSFDMLATVVHPYPTYSFELQAMAAEVYYKKLSKLGWLFSILKFVGL